ncbi:4-hydroxythreonine-4-phosphate dehydrogenase PdxA [Rubrobacter indicoceani]|uniref:4-hydroxythreonine-4-phosphate dehydrogenase PdxA n=1 Tax=Rubrobacter indicoceani TaxID=2051957 RepID=UPI000E5BFA22|nr:4-hydroxythreonine-4-phosphate dehydrogenase PdxA [Rubrobacter indicoceani]
MSAQSETGIGLTMGDPAGIGPEIIAKSFAEDGFASGCRAVVIGDEAVMTRTVGELGLPLGLNVVSHPREAAFKKGYLDLVPVGALPGDLPVGRLDARCGRAAYGYVERAATLALEGSIAAVCTAPLNKEAMHLGGIRYAGHTEILAGLTATEDYAMMLVAPDLRVIHVSTHVSLGEAILRATEARERTVIRLAHETLRRIGVENPRVAVAGINPHAGENGLFGREEIEAIAPAIEAARGDGIDASGPWSADTVFGRARRGDFDIVVVQYHDQGHIPVKLLGFEKGVNVTVGLPFFRTSVDHGTAFDIAGEGVADPSSLLAALDLADRLAGSQKSPRRKEKEDPA